VAIAPESVESWHHGDVIETGMHGANPQFKIPLPPPSHSTHLEIHVRLRDPETESAAPTPDSSLLTPGSVNWQELETLWAAILRVEATVETLRINMDGLLAEMESLWKKPLTMEEKTYGPRADMASVTQAKKRVHTAVPKLRDFVHRATWVMGAPERKRLEEIYNDLIHPQIPFPHVAQVQKQLEDLRKDRQVLATNGTAAYQECKGIAAELQSAMKALQANAAKLRRNKSGGGRG
jgi:hypothetical protein